MSVYALRAEVSRLESKLHEIQRENDRLRSEITTGVNGVYNADNELSRYNDFIRNTLENVANTINRSNQRAFEAYELQGEIDQLYTRYKAVEFANKRIRALNNKKYYDFNNYRTVRKIVRGMMDNLDLSMVSDKIIYKSVEKQHLKSPDFWLTGVLLSIMAWKSDDRSLADRALESSFRLDKKNSSIFYMIFNLRMNREQSALKWFMEYQRCDLKGSDADTFLLFFSMISKTLSDSMDSMIVHSVTDYINNMVVTCVNGENYSEDEMIYQLLHHMKSGMKYGGYELPGLAGYCSDYGKIETMLNYAKHNGMILEKIRRIINVRVVEKNTYLKEYLNDLLEKPNDVEIETYNEIEYNETVIRLTGDVKAAKAEHEEKMKKRSSDFHIISTLIDWVYDFSNEKINEQMRINMFMLFKNLQEKAAKAYITQYRTMFRTSYAIDIQGYSSSVDFSNESMEVAKVEQFYLEQQKNELAQVKNLMAYLAYGAGAICGVAAFFVHLFLLAGLVIGVVTGTGILVSNHFKKKNIILRIQKQKENVVKILHGLYAEFEKMVGEFQEYDNISNKIMEELAGL